MVLRLYNTLTRKKEEFQPLDPANVRMYVCGPTVYDFAHIGNARPVIVFDVLFRLLRHLYGPDHVTYIRNITDVDDKINARALRDFPDLPLNEAIRRVTEKTTAQFHADVAALGCLPPTVEPRATENIAGMIEMIQALLDKRFAYVAQGAEGREALFDVKMMRDYGALSRRSLEDQEPGARVAVEAHKRNPEDFVLWKESRSSEPGWPAEFNLTEENKNELLMNSNHITIFGRPGWHIECSAMSKRYLGEVFDIHGGGLDLIFPHHENEIAQSRCAFGTNVMANVWMHNGFLQVEGQKMSKSLGNFVTINDALKYRTGENMRLAMLMTNYTQPINWTNDRLKEAYNWLQDWHRSIPDGTVATEPFEEVVEALNDDLNTWQALVFLNKVQMERKRSATGMFSIDAWYSETAAKFKASANLMGLMQQASFKIFHDELRHRQMSYDLDSLPGTKELVELRIAARLEARKAKNWAESDRLRDELAAMGIAIMDNKDGTTTWEMKR